MGGCFSSSNVIHDITENQFYQKLASSGVREDCRIEIYIDCTASNIIQLSNGAQYSYHDSTPLQLGIYAQVMSACVTMLKQDNDCRIPIWCFGSVNANENKETPGIFCWGDYMIENGDPSSLIAAYHHYIQYEKLSGPTTFIPIIKQAIHDYQQYQKYQIIVIITDGLISEYKEHKEWFRKASNYPISFVIIGIGNADFRDMQKLDDLGKRKVDNVQFTSFNDIIKQHEDLKSRQNYFFYKTFMEIPIQYENFKNVLNYKPSANGSGKPQRQPSLRPSDKYELI